jgi:hypothetical protein
MGNSLPNNIKITGETNIVWHFTECGGFTLQIIIGDLRSPSGESRNNPMEIKKTLRDFPKGS